MTMEISPKVSSLKQSYLMFVYVEGHRIGALQTWDVIVTGVRCNSDVDEEGLAHPPLDE